MSDELAIRQLQQTWFSATMAGDVETLQSLMTEDVVFLTAGKPPIRKREFLESVMAMSQQVSIACAGEYEEIAVVGDIAYTQSRLDIRVTPKNGSPSRQLTGHALSILRRSTEGKWQLCRDANLVSVKPG